MVQCNKPARLIDWLIDWDVRERIIKIGQYLAKIWTHVRWRRVTDKTTDWRWCAAAIVAVGLGFFITIWLVRKPNTEWIQWHPFPARSWCARARLITIASCCRWSSVNRMSMSFTSRSRSRFYLFVSALYLVRPTHRSIYKYLDRGLPSLNVAYGDPLKLTSPAQHASRWRMRGSQTCRLLHRPRAHAPPWE